jgi:hypothetical protein
MVAIAKDMDPSQQGTEKCVPQYAITSVVVETAGKVVEAVVELNIVCSYWR